MGSGRGGVDAHSLTHSLAGVTRLNMLDGLDLRDGDAHGFMRDQSRRFAIYTKCVSTVNGERKPVNEKPKSVAQVT
jgi:hypothetical protein